MIRFQTREPSKPVLSSSSSLSTLNLNVGFRLIWSDVEFNTPGNPLKEKDPLKNARIRLSPFNFHLLFISVFYYYIENCSKHSRFACTEARFCFTKNHMGGSSNCPDLRHYCISTELVCDNVPHCGETNPSDELNCTSSLILCTMYRVYSLSVLTYISCTINLV